ncbi:hypothetical protein ACQY0O_004726 [Thecaphora frezii]
MQDSEETLRLQIYHPTNVAYNAQQLYYIRSTSLSLCGSIAGVLGLTNLSGLYLYLLTLVLTNALILTVNARSAPHKYLIPPSFSSSDNKSSQQQQKKVEWDAKQWIQTLGQGAQENAFSFVLWWTFWLAVVHVYD